MPLSFSACWPAVNLRLATDPTVSERASGGIGGIEPLDLLWVVPFRLQRRWWVCSPALKPLFLESVWDFFPVLTRAGLPKANGWSLQSPNFGSAGN